MPGGAFAGVADAQARHEAELDGLLGDREGAGDHRLAGNDRCRGGDQHQGQAKHVGREIEERVLDLVERRRAVGGQDHRALPEIIEEQRRKDEIEPRHPDRLASEMPHVGVERLGAGHGENDRAERREGFAEIGGEEMIAVQRVDHRQEDAWMVDDVRDPENRDGDEVEQHHRPEHQADLGGPARLDREQTDEDGDRDRDDERLEAAAHRLQALDRRQHRHRRRDHRIAVEQRRREDSEHDDPARPALLAAERAIDESEQREAAALALVVGAHDDGDVFQRHDDHHRPEDQAEHAVDVQPVGNQGVVAGERLAEGVDRRGADVAIDDPDRADGKLVQRPLSVAVRNVLRRLGLGASSCRNVHGFSFWLDRSRIRIPVALAELLGHGRAALALPLRCCNL